MLKRPSPEQMAIMDAVIDNGNREACVLILHAILKESRWPYRLFSRLIKESMVGWSLIHYIQIVHLGDVKSAVKELESQMMKRTDRLHLIERRN